MLMIFLVLQWAEQLSDENNLRFEYFIEIYEPLAKQGRYHLCLCAAERRDFIEILFEEFGPNLLHRINIYVETKLVFVKQSNHEFLRQDVLDPLRRWRQKF
ncbi:hypothetical protein GcM3_082043 [Golovinomyces cichoracearum]|uniref:Uncharacterized protein n=1 Tax=Golovinomyces cichoracearum TaxID=62708 RepID=A0A420IMQ2_9PEZI|nr:hypothetical protein GcM3_082043 [Golovinomyces cichoracearum]